MSNVKKIGFQISNRAAAQSVLTTSPGQWFTKEDIKRIVLDEYDILLSDITIYRAMWELDLMNDTYEEKKERIGEKKIWVTHYSIKNLSQ